MSIRQELFNQLESMQDREGDWIVASTSAIADGMGRNPATISKNLNSLAQHGNVELRKDDGKVTAVKIVRPPRAYRKATSRGDRPKKVVRAHDSTTRRFGSSMPTPRVDEYAKAKAAFEEMMPRLGEYVKAEWNVDPLAEEALALKNYNSALVSQLSELRANYETVSREAEYLRTKNDSQLRNGLKEAGLLVEHAN